MWLIKAAYLYFVGVVLFPSKTTKCNYRKILVTVGYASAPLILNGLIFDIKLLYFMFIPYIWYNISLIIGILILTLEGNFIRSSAYIVYCVVTLMLLIVLFMPAIKGAHSWFKIGGFTIQPSEFSKFATSLAIAHYLSTTGVKIQEAKTKLIVDQQKELI